ncbi:MAG: hypothetical protein ABIL15_00130 [candidate division WOR-3 bacterium]
MKRIVTLSLILTVIAFGRSAISVPQNRPFDLKLHNINNVEMWVSNFGKFGQTKQGNAGLFWPKGSGQNYIFGAGSWFGTIDGTDTLVTIGYGPHGGETEYTPGLKDMSSGDPNAIIFLYPSPWPPPPDVFPMAPQTTKSHQDSWCAYNDLDINNHVPGDTRPIGLEVYQTVYAWNLTTTKDIIFIRYELKNVSGKKLTNCYFGVCTDNDIGNEAGTNANDIISGIVIDTFIIDGEPIVVDNLGYQWQTADEPLWDDVGAIGFDYLQSPWDLKEGQDKDDDGIPDQYERDSAYYAQNVPPAQWDVDSDGTPDWRDPSEIPQMGMTAFKRFTLNLEPNKDNERYVTLAGYNFKTGEHTPYDTVPPQPDDQRFLQCSGPFELEPDSIAIVLVGIMLTYWPRGIVERPDTALAKIDQTVQFIYDMNWLLPGPPPPPKLTCVPGDNKITLIWDNSPESAPDPYYDVVGNPSSPNYDPFYKKYDFEGYRIWKSQTGKTGTWGLLASYDLTNGITFKDTTMPDSIALEAKESGIVHSFVDTDVRNGFNYYYAVTAFDYNFVKTIEGIDTFPKPIWFESGLTGVSASPRRDPVNLVNGSLSKNLISGNAKLSEYTKGDIVYPLATENDSCFVKFAPPKIDSFFEIDTTGQIVKRFRGGYASYLLDKNKNAVDSASFHMNFGASTIHEFVPYKGMIAKISFVLPNIPNEQIEVFSGVEVEGTYPESLLKVERVNLYTSPAAWTYRGNDYEIIWKAVDGVVKTVVVIDKCSGDTVPFTPYTNNVTTADRANGWCFTNTKNVNWTPSDTLRLTGGVAVTTKFLYINGGLLALNRGTSMTQRPSASDVWTVYANPKYPPAPVCGIVKFAITPAYLRTDTTYTLNVKVVPNPYIVHNEWQQSSLIRRLKFINLPSECTVRIFTINGDLVKTIIHKSTIGSVQGDAGGDEWWDLLTENRQLVASGVYVFHVDSKVGQQVGKFVVIR